MTLLKRIPEAMYEHTVVVDDASDVSLQKLPCQVIRHSTNTGYGAAQKSAYRVLMERPTIRQIILLHGDDQYDFESLWHAADMLHDVQLGSRYIHGQTATRVPKWRKWGNHLLTGTANHWFRTHYTDLHTGARLYSTDWLRKVPLTHLSDDFVFDQQILAHALQRRTPIIEFSIPANYDDGVSSISFRRSIRYGFGCLATLWAAKRAKF